MWQSLLKILLALLLGIAIGYSQKKTKTVTKVQKRVSIDTVILERPDGTKITTIKERSNTKSYTKTESIKPQWSIGGLYNGRDYGIIVQRRILGDLFLGGYGIPGKHEYGLAVTYQF